MPQVDFAKIAEFAAASLKAAEAKPKPWDARLPDYLFPAASLSAWMSIVEAAGVPTVPADVVAEIPLRSLIKFDHFDDPEICKDLEVLGDLSENHVPDTMLRWDCCAPMRIKSTMGRPGAGDCPPVEHIYLTPDDPRAYEILYEFPVEKVKVLRRPWIQAMMHDGFPVEFRVFINDNQVVAVSNYYPQMSLPETPEFVELARKAAELAGEVLEELIRTSKMPFNPRRKIDSAGPIDATLDFLVERETGRVLFLEAGPGWGCGAHPCCFLDDETGKVDEVSGVRLGMKGQTVSLVEQ